MNHPKINVIVWKENYEGAYTFQRRPVPTDPHFLVVRIAGKEYDYRYSTGLHISEIDTLPHDAREITRAEANAMPALVY